MTIAREQFSSGHRRFLAVGGDGTVNELVNGLMGCDRAGPRPMIAALPLGSGNDFVRSRGLPHDPGTLVPRLREPKIAPCRVGMVESLDPQNPWKRYFVNCVGFGLDVSVLEHLPRWRTATLRYLVGVLRAFATHDAVTARLVCDGKEETRRVLIALCALGVYSGGGMCLAPHAAEEPERLAVGIAGPLPWRRLLQGYQLYTGKVGQWPEVTLCHVRAFAIVAPADAPIQIDGEIVGRTPIRVSLCEETIDAITTG
jgi:diacylglycerol kinase family enzyme